MKPLVPLIVLLMFSASCSGTTSVQVASQDIFYAQAIVRVTTNQSGNCTYRISEGSVFNAEVNDVNTVLFSGANSDARSGSIINGTSHVFVGGTRTAEKAADGHFYSRSLQVNTLHWVGVTCGPDAEVSTTFTTLNPPLGSNGPEVMPFDVTAFGNVAVPTINWTNRSATYNDPLWGTQLHRMTDPADNAFYAVGTQYPPGSPSFTYALSSNGHWTNPNNVLSASSSSLATCDTSSSCTTSDALVLIAIFPGGSTNYSTNGGWDPSMAYLDFLVRMWGSGTDTSSASRTVAVCWSVDDQTCFTSSQNVVLPQTTAAFAGTVPQSWSVQTPWSGVTGTTLRNIVVASGVATLNFAAAHGLSSGGQICINGIRSAVTTAQGGNGLNGCHTIASTPTSTSLTFTSNAYPATYTDSELIASPNFPQALWASWGTPPTHNLVGTRQGGTVTATAGALVLSGSGTESSFDPAWVSGTKIYIAGSSPTCTNNLCTVSSVTDALHLALVENLSISGASWTSANFSLLIRKTTSTGAVSLSAGFDFVYGSSYNNGDSGVGDICSPNYVTVSVDANGNSITPVQGYLCVASSTGGSNAASPIYLFIPSTGETRLIARTFQAAFVGYRQWIGWHPTNGASWFTTYIGGGQSVYQVVYGGDFRALTPGFPQNVNEAGTPEQLTFTDIFAGSGSDIPTQLANCQTNGTCNSGINSSLFVVPPAPPFSGGAIAGSYMVMCSVATGGGQNSPGYVSMWNIGTTPATLAWAGYTFDAFPVGYGGVHSCSSFGNGQFNVNGINQSGGANNGPFKGPWQQTPTMYDSNGTGYKSNTSVLLTDGFECPSGLNSKWQALGAKPLASGGVAKCLKFKIPGDFCSANATVAESTAYPCPWNAASNYSLIKAIGEGDEVGDAPYGQDSYGEKMLVVKVMRNSTTDIDLLVFRYSDQSITPNSGFTCGAYVDSQWNHANGWTMQAYPFYSCGGSNYWVNTADSTHTFIAENPNIIGSHADFGQGSSGYTYVEGATLSGYITRANQPMPQQIGGPPTAQIMANPRFGSTQLPDVFLQSYPSKRQKSALTPPSEMDWALDVRSYNPSFGNSAENGEGLFGNTVSLVSGHTNTYLVAFSSNESPDPKIAGFVGWAGYHMLADASGSSSASSFGDSTLWHYCYAYKSGECVSGSKAGQMYASVPFDLTANACIVNSYAYNALCISNNYPYGFWVTQFNTTKTDSVGVTSRRLTSALVAPGRQYNFTNAKPTPDGKWVVVQAQWLEGQRTDLFWVKMPPFPTTVSNSGVTLTFSGVTGDTIRIAFGYAENGIPANFYCTSRAETCYTSASATTKNPFVYASEAQSYKTCGSGCTVTIPSSPGRALYYQVQRRNGSNTTTSPVGVIFTGIKGNL